MSAKAPPRMVRIFGRLQYVDSNPMSRVPCESCGLRSHCRDTRSMCSQFTGWAAGSGDWRRLKRWPTRERFDRYYSADDDE